MDDQHYLYQIVNLVNGRYYIGVHDNSKPAYFGSGIALKSAIKKYGKQNFRKDILAEGLSKRLAYQLERAVVDEKFIADVANYNIKIGGWGGGVRGAKQRKRGPMSEEQKARLRGRKHTLEAKAKIAARRGWKHTPETLEKMRQRARNRRPEFWVKFKQTQTGRRRDGECGKWLPKDDVTMRTEHGV